jgi:excisionase family DNA binding protein
MANSDPLPQLLTIDQLADRLGVSTRHIRRLVAERRVPYLKVGWFIRFDPVEISGWLDDTRRPTGSSARSVAS